MSVATVLCVALPGSAVAGDPWIESLSKNVMYGIGGAIAATKILLGDELSVETTLGEEIEVSDNIALDVDPPGGGAISTTTAATGSIRTTHRTRELEFRATAEKVDVTGPGDPGNLESENEFYFSRYNNTQKRFRYNVRSARTIQNAAAAQLQDSTIPTLEDTPGDPETGGTITEFQTQNITSVDEVQETFIVGGDIALQLNERNALFFSAEAVQQSFTDVVDSNTNGGTTSELVDSETITTALAWTRQLSEAANLTASVSNQEFKPAGEGDSRKLETRGILNVQVSPRLEMTFDGGVAFVSGEGETTNGNGSSNLINTGSGSSAAFVGAFGFSYDLKRTKISFEVSRQVSPTSTGDLDLVEGIAISIDHDINRRSSIALNSRYTKQTTPPEFAGAGGSSANQVVVTGPGSEREFFRVTPTYSITFKPGWSAGLSYEYAREISSSSGATNSNAASGGDAVAQSNSVFFTIKRAFPVER